LSRVASIYNHILHHTSPDEPGLLPGGERLPDEGFVLNAGRFAPGSRDQVGRRPTAIEIQPVLDALGQLCWRPGPQSRRHLESLMRTRRCIDLVDPLLEAVRKDPRIAPEALYVEMRHLLVESHWREVVKLSIAILGLYQRAADSLLFAVLGRHEEFTFFAAIAIGHSLTDPVPIFMRLVRQVQGWGKIELIKHLIKYDDRSDVHQWLLRYGCVNTVSENHLALLIAEACKLDEALALTQPDEPLLAGAQAIIGGLLTVGPAPGMERYEGGAQASLRWVSHMAGRPLHLRSFLVGASLVQWIDGTVCPWPAEVAREVRARAMDWLSSPGWADLALSKLDDPDSAEPWMAREVARWLDLPVFERLLTRLTANARDLPLWQYLVAGATREQMEMLLSVPCEVAPDLLGTLLVGLRRFPGLGVPLVMAGLQSTEPLPRLQALDVLGRWPVSMVPSDTYLGVLTLSRDDPHGVVRKSARVVLHGWKKPGAS
jgi:hypothetical protein